jgi:O-antigen ligase
MKGVKNKKKCIQVLGLISIILLLLIIVFQTTISDEIIPTLRYTYEEIKNTPILLKTDYTFNEVTSFTNEYGASRVFIWLQAIQYIKRSPVFGNGVGYEAFLGAENKIMQVYSRTQHYVATYHNQSIAFLIDYGFVGTFLIYFIFIKIGFLGLRLLKESNISKIQKHSVYSFITIYIIYFLPSFIGGEMIPAHPDFYTVIPLWLFMAAIIAEYKKKVEIYKITIKEDNSFQ